MPDREKVINGLKCCNKDGYAKEICPDCPYADKNPLGCIEQLMSDAIALLREQEKPDCEHAERDGIGCLGYAGCTQDDEPIDACKTCRKYTGNRCEEVIMDD